MLCHDLTTSDFFPPAWVVGRSGVQQGVGVGVVVVVFPYEMFLGFLRVFCIFHLCPTDLGFCCSFRFTTPSSSV